MVGLTCDESKLPRELRKVEIFQHKLVLSFPTRYLHFPTLFIDRILIFNKLKLIRKQREEILSLYLSKLKLFRSDDEVMSDYITKLVMV